MGLEQVSYLENLDILNGSIVDFDKFSMGTDLSFTTVVKFPRWIKGFLKLYGLYKLD